MKLSRLGFLKEAVLITVLVFAHLGCSSDSSDADSVAADAAVIIYSGEPVLRPAPPENAGKDGFSKGCYALDLTEPNSDNTRWLALSESGGAYGFTARDLETAQAFYMQASDLGTYLFYDASKQYLTWSETGLSAVDTLNSADLSGDPDFISPAEWVVDPSPDDPARFRLTHRATGGYLAPGGVTMDPAGAGVVAFYPVDGCTPHPELTLDATGQVTRTRFDDGDLFGIVDSHSHIFSDIGFGPGFHGAPFHRLGVEHALGDCDPTHGVDGRKDLWGYFTDGNSNSDVQGLFLAIAEKEAPDFNHRTDGYPTFSAWPAGPFLSTHQTQYYRWLERAWMGGLRMVVQHAVANRVICQLQAYVQDDPDQYHCNDMRGVEESILATYAMERYIDAQAGGPGKGFFQVVTTPAEAREVIAEGKMAVLLGIETSNLFDCFSTETEDQPVCDAAHVSTELAKYHELGVRVLFPVHKYDNGFSAGDGHRGIIELANFINSGNYSSYVQDCDLDAPNRFDGGSVAFGGLNKPREIYLGPPAEDMSQFREDPIFALIPFVNDAFEGPLDGDWCQGHGLTPMGEFLLGEMMKLGMIVEMDHFPRRSYERAFQILTENDYPAIGTHGENFNGRIYGLGGMSKTNLDRCHDPSGERNPARRFIERAQQIAELGGYPAEGFGFDLNGFAGAPGPRFGDNARCDEPQENPVEYPFSSVAGDAEFTQPKLGERTLDFNTEGFVHIGLLPELIQDARLGGASEADLEPLFRSAEGYIRMWEKAEARGAVISQQE